MAKGKKCRGTVSLDDDTKWVLYLKDKSTLVNALIRKEFGSVPTHDVELVSDVCGKAQRIILQEIEKNSD